MTELMDPIKAQAHVDGLVAQLRDAAVRRDRTAFVAALASLTADGYPAAEQDAWDVLLDPEMITPELKEVLFTALTEQDREATPE